MNIRELINLFRTDPFWQFSSHDIFDPSQVHRRQQYQAAYGPLPEDYLEIFSICDGFALRRGDHRIEEMDMVAYMRNYPGNSLLPNMLEIGMSQDSVLMIDRDRSHTPSYLFIGPSCTLEGFDSIGTITDFFNAVVENHGNVPEWMATGMGPFSFRED